MADTEIEELTVKQGQQRDAKKHKTFDREMDAYRRGKENLTDEERIDRLKDNADLRNRLIQATGFEVGAGGVVDWATTPLMAAPPVYAGVNFVAGSAINTLAQLWRQDDNFSWGEVAASGAVGVVPGLGGKATIAKGAIKGAASGVAHEAIRIGIDEKRLPTAEEAVVGGTVGTVVGGGVTGAIKGGSTLKDRLLNRIDYDEILDPNIVFRPGSKEDLFRQRNVVYGMSQNIDGTFEPTHWTKLKSRTLDNLLKESDKGKGNIRYVQNLIRQLDEYRLKNPDLDMPIQGFTKDLGRRPTFIGPKGEEFGIGWSRKKFKKTGVGYEVYNVQQRLQSRAKRISQSKASNPHNASEAAVLFALKRHINKTSRIWDPTQRKYITKPVGEWDIMIQNPGSAYVEHLVSVDSPYWKSTRGIKSGIKAGDPDNLTIIGDRNFKTLKDSVEKHIHTNYDNLYVDYNRSSQNLVIRDLKTGTSYKTEIPGYGNAKDFRTYIEDTLQNKPMKTLEEVNPDMPPNVKRQIKGTEKEGWYFKD